MHMQVARLILEALVLLAYTVIKGIFQMHRRMLIDHPKTGCVQLPAALNISSLACHLSSRVAEINPRRPAPQNSIVQSLVAYGAAENEE